MPGGRWSGRRPRLADERRVGRVGRRRRPRDAAFARPRAPRSGGRCSSRAPPLAGHRAGRTTGADLSHALDPGGHRPRLPDPARRRRAGRPHPARGVPRRRRAHDALRPRRAPTRSSATRASSARRSTGSASCAGTTAPPSRCSRRQPLVCGSTPTSRSSRRAAGPTASTSGAAASSTATPPRDGSTRPTTTWAAARRAPPDWRSRALRRAARRVGQASGPVGRPLPGDLEGGPGTDPVDVRPRGRRGAGAAQHGRLRGAGDRPRARGLGRRGLPPRGLSAAALQERRQGGRGPGTGPRPPRGRSGAAPRSRRSGPGCTPGRDCCPDSPTRSCGGSTRTAASCWRPASRTSV